MSRLLNRRTLILLGIMVVLVVVLSGCGTNSIKTHETKDLLEGGIWDRYFVFPVSYGLDKFAELFWGQYGLSILIVTIIIRFIILPLNLKQYKSTKQMQALQPELKKIKEKHKDDARKQQEETMKLFQEHGVNPLAGCLPLIVQMPVLFALYRAIMVNADIREHHFLWMQLGEKDHYFILPIIAAITTYLQQKIMSKYSPNMNSQMQMLFLIFPVLIFVMAMSFPSALPLYWIYGNLFTMAQTYFIYGRGEQPEVAISAKGGATKGTSEKGGGARKGGKSK